MHGQMLHGQMLHVQMVLGRLSTVKDGFTNLKYPRWYSPWGWVGEGVGGLLGWEKLKSMLTQSSCAEAGTELGNNDRNSGH